MGVAIVSALPLYPSFGLLESTFARAKLNRFLRSALTVSLATATAVVVTLVAPREIVTWFVLIAALGLVAAALMAERSWAVVLVAGVGSLTIDHMIISSPVREAMVLLGLPRAAAVYVVAWTAFLLVPVRGGSTAG